MSTIFNFKQFSINQANCAMKVNTDGVLLAALAEFRNPNKILDVGTGTGLVALMLAQKYPLAFIKAVEIDENAASAAKSNFFNSPFSKRIELFHSSVKDHFTNRDDKYDLIISNPPFFINSLNSLKHEKGLARHTDISFFEFFLAESEYHLNQTGHICIILPLQTSELIKKIISCSGLFKVQKEILIYSFPESNPHRIIMVLGFKKSDLVKQKLVIYLSKGVYSTDYRNLLKDYLTIF